MEMTALSDLLAERLEVEPRRPSDVTLGGGITATAYWSFDPNLEIVVAETGKPPADGTAQSAWRKRLDRRPIPLVLLIESGDDGALIVGPGGDPPPVFKLDPHLVVSELAEAAELDPLDVRRRLPEAFKRARGAAGLTGVRNVGLFSTHYLRSRAPQLPGWEELDQQGRTATRTSSLPKRLEALGFEAEKREEGIYVLRAEGRPAAAVLSYPPGRDLDRAASGGELPVAGLLREMEAAGARWGILASGEIWRLYDSEHPARTTSFAELDLEKISEPAYFAALFSAEALRGGGLAETIAEGSRKFAVGLGNRLRERIYVEVVPRIVRAIAAELERTNEPPTTRAELAAVYEATLTLLYRLLFVLYAEAREYLPVSASAGYAEHSLRKRVDATIATERSGRDFDPRQTDIWSDLQETFNAVSAGHTEWGVPPYNGGLFQDDAHTAVGSILRTVQPTNAGLGQALYHLGVDVDEGKEARIDYADLGIRHLGDVYEGLLQFEVERARENLAYDPDEDTYFGAGEDDEVSISEGTLYLRTKKGGRKGSGTYYTPQIVVRHLVSEAVLRTFDDHLGAVERLADAGDEETAATLLWEFRLCDPAMGSGHFLVDALDVLTDRVAKFLSERPLKPVRAVIGQLREMVQAQAKDLPPGVLAEIRDVELLKRVVLKHSIYGVDQNPMAVELAKLALWLDAFVPGLPLSYLDHNLKSGNSLVGVIGEEVREALVPERGTLEGNRIDTQLVHATARARDAVERVELRLQDIEAAREAEYERQQALGEVETLFNRWTAESFGLEGARDRIADEHTLEAADDERQASPIAAAQQFFHWALEFPEVFAAPRRGFDVIVGNPPWDKVRFEPQHHWVALFPGLNRLSDTDREAAIEELRQAHPQDFEREQEAEAQSKVMQSVYSIEYELQGTHGHLDLAKLFLERALEISGKEGSLGMVLPRQFLVLRGWQALREATLEGAETSVAQLSNRANWVFKEVDGRYMFALLRRRPHMDEEGSLDLRGGIDRAELMPSDTGLTLHWTVPEMREFSEILAIPVLPRERDAEIFARLVKLDRLSDPNTIFGGVHSDTPYDWTDASRREVVLRAPLPDGAHRILQTRHVGQFHIDATRELRKGVPPDDALRLLDEKWRRSRELAEQLDPAPASAEQAEDLYRIVYRYATMATNSRSLIPALMPRGYLSAKGYAHSAVPMKNDATHRLALLGCLATITADWWTRRFVDRHLTSSVLRSIPAPAWDEEVLKRAAQLTARLACEPGDPMLSELGLDNDALASDPGERVGLIAELELLYAEAVGLRHDDLDWMVRSFNEEGVPHDLRKALGISAESEVAA